MQPHSGTPSAATLKADLRTQVAAARSRLTRLSQLSFSAHVVSGLRSIAAYHQAKVVLSYASIRGEVATESIHHDVVRSGRRLFLPVPDGQPRFRSWRPGESMDVGPQGFRGPTAGDSFAGAADGIVLVPLVAWDAGGRRLGRGAGFYDRILAQMPDTILRIGLAFDFQRYERLPNEAWDCLLHLVVTESGVHPCHGLNVCSPTSTAEKEWHRF